MLSALAKYIFGGVMGDTPETTSMQYETREINDWLLVDMPDQDIDNEDMNSESDDDDILTAVPLLLAEEVPMSPRQIVLSYEPHSSCDKSYAKIQKGFQDKIHSASAKVQVHTSDKIQAVVLEHVKDLKPIQQAMQYEARKYLTRSQLNRQNRNYIYQASSKTNRRRNLQRNHSGVNNNRKCC